MFDRTRLTASKLSADARRAGRERPHHARRAAGGTSITAPFTVEAALADDGPRATLVFANPYPAAGLQRRARGARADARRLPHRDRGPVDARAVRRADRPDHARARADADRHRAARRVAHHGHRRRSRSATARSRARWRSPAAGSTARSRSRRAAAGRASTSRSPPTTPRFGGPTPLAIRQATIDAQRPASAQGSSTVNGSARGAGISYGTLFIGRLAAQRRSRPTARGTFQASLTGRRGSRFDAAARRRRRARADRGRGARRLRRARDRRCRAARCCSRPPTAAGRCSRPSSASAAASSIAEGRFGGDAAGAGPARAWREMPLSLLDVVGGDLGLGGTVSGIVDFGAGPDGVPTGEARVMVDDLTRSGLVLSSRPIDLALVARLSPSQLAGARGAAGRRRRREGRLQARIAGLPAVGRAGRPALRRRPVRPAALRRAGRRAVAAVDDRADRRHRHRCRSPPTSPARSASPQVRGSLAGDALRRAERADRHRHPQRARARALLRLAAAADQLRRHRAQRRPGQRQRLRRPRRT